MYNILLGHPWIHDMQAIPSTYHQCIKFLYNRDEIMILEDNTMSINTLIIAKILLPHNRPSHDPSASLLAFEEKLKMVSIGMGE